MTVMNMQRMPKRRQVRPLKVRTATARGARNHGDFGVNACAVVTAWPPYSDHDSLAQVRGGRYATDPAKRGVKPARSGVDPPGASRLAPAERPRMTSRTAASKLRVRRLHQPPRRCRAALGARMNYENIIV